MFSKIQLQLLKTIFCNGSKYMKYMTFYINAKFATLISFNSYQSDQANPKLKTMVIAQGKVETKQLIVDQKEIKNYMLVEIENGKYVNVRLLEENEQIKFRQYQRLKKSYVFIFEYYVNVDGSDVRKVPLLVSTDIDTIEKWNTVEQTILADTTRVMIILGYNNTKVMEFQEVEEHIKGICSKEYVRIVL